MKAEITSKKKEFEPITIELTIESEEELCNLWLRASLGPYIINKETVSVLKFNADHSDSGLFYALDDEVKRLNLYK